LIYLDTSVVVSLYSPDANSAAAVGFLQTCGDALLITTLCEMETVNALELRVFRKQISRSQAEVSLSNFALDLRNGVLQLRRLTDLVLERTRQLSRQWTAALGSRTADVLHVAAALELGASSFYSFDLQQRKLAEAVGLILNPFP
jgi:predicted nucleic acid-binding protein